MSAAIHPSAIVAPGARLGADARIGPYCIVSAETELGDGVALVAHVVTEGRVRIGAGTVVHPFAVLGGEPQIKPYVDVDTTLEIGERNVIREHVTFHRGSTRGTGVTRIGSDGLFMGQAHVAHDCLIGDGVILAQGATLGGHAELADGVYVGGHAAVHQFCRVGRAAFIGGLAAITRDVAPFALASGNPATMQGLNLRGLMRRGLPRERLRALARAHDALFRGDGAFSDRLAAAPRGMAPEFDEILDFLAVPGKRPLMGAGA